MSGSFRERAGRARASEDADRIVRRQLLRTLTPRAQREFGSGPAVAGSVERERDQFGPGAVASRVEEPDRSGAVARPLRGDISNLGGKQ